MRPRPRRLAAGAQAAEETPEEVTFEAWPSATAGAAREEEAEGQQIEAEIAVDVPWRADGGAVTVPEEAVPQQESGWQEVGAWAAWETTEEGDTEDVQVPAAIDTAVSSGGDDDVVVVEGKGVREQESDVAADVAAENLVGGGNTVESAAEEMVEVMPEVEAEVHAEVGRAGVQDTAEAAAEPELADLIDKMVAEHDVVTTQTESADAAGVVVAALCLAATVGAGLYANSLGQKQELLAAAL